MASYAEITRVFAHDTDIKKDTCVGVYSDSQLIIDRINNLNPDLSLNDLIAILNTERIEHYIYDRPKRRGHS